MSGRFLVKFVDMRSYEDSDQQFFSYLLTDRQNAVSVVALQGRCRV